MSHIVFRSVAAVCGRNRRQVCVRLAVLAIWGAILLGPDGVSEGAHAAIVTDGGGGPAPELPACLVGPFLAAAARVTAVIRRRVLFPTPQGQSPR